MSKISRHFTSEEFACTCCGEQEIDLLFVLALDRARESAATPFHITSGYRCPEHPETLKNPTSSHTVGLAADIATPDSHTRFLILRALLEHGFTRLGVADSFIHVDVDDSKPERVMWTYAARN